MSIPLFAVVTLRRDDPATGVPAGAEGTVVAVRGNGAAYTVEFFNGNGDTIEASLLRDYSPEELEVTWRPEAPALPAEQSRKP